MRNPVYRDVEDDLLSKSLAYLMNNGLENISLREFCKSTGISMGSIYYWFEGKDQLIVETAEYGLEKVTGSVFSSIYQSPEAIDTFFENCLEIISQYKLQLRLIYQIATSPQYGERIRKKNMEELGPAYFTYITELANILGCDAEKLKPLVFLFISMMLDYVVWEDPKVSQMQADYIYAQIKSICAKETV